MNNNGDNLRKVLYVLIAVLLIIIIGGAGWYFMKTNEQKRAVADSLAVVQQAEESAQHELDELFRDSTLMLFAKKTGWYDASLTSRENVERLKDSGFQTWLLDRFNQFVKNGLKIVQTGTWGDDYYEGEWMSSQGATFTVKNSTDHVIPGSAYSITYKEGYWGGGNMSKEVVPGETIAPGGTVLLKTKELGASMESETGQELNVKELDVNEFMSIYQPTGKEYAEYLQERGNAAPARKETSSSASNSVEFVIEGLMGNCGTRLSMSGDTGYLLYNPNGKSMDTLQEQRSVTLLHYDSNTGDIALEVRTIEGTKTGTIKGTYRDGSFQGRFINVNGNTSPMSLQ